MIIFKKIFLLLVFSFLIFSLFSEVSLAQKPLEIQYPPVPGPGVLVPTTTKTPLPEYIRYIFNLALMVAGLIAFGSLVYGGFRYTTSAGNPTQLSDAQSQMFAGILGLIVLVSSYLILTTINPQLITLKTVTMPSLGVILYDAYDAKGQEKRIGVSQSLGDFNGESIRFLSPGKVEAIIFDAADYKGNSTTTTTDGNLPFTAKSIILSWLEPGVYLYGETDKEQLWTNTMMPFLMQLNDKVKKIVFKGDLPFTAILHEDSGYQGQCRIFLPDGKKEWTDVMSGKDDYGKVNNVSSVTVFLRGGEASAGENIKLCKDPEYTDCGTITDFEITAPRFVGNVFGLGSDFNDAVRSIKIEGNYLVVLTEHAPEDPNFPGKCQVFDRRNDPDLKDDPIGMCDVDCFLFWCNKAPCTSSVSIYHVK